MSKYHVDTIPLVQNMAAAMSEARRLIECGRHQEAADELAKWTATPEDAWPLESKLNLGRDASILRGFIEAHSPFATLKQHSPMLDIATAFALRAMLALDKLPEAQAREVLLAACHLSTFGVCLVLPERPEKPDGAVH